MGLTWIQLWSNVGVEDVGGPNHRGVWGGGVGECRRREEVDAWLMRHCWISWNSR